MTTYRIVCAGCNEEIIKKFSIVADLFKARSQSLIVKFEPWDGTRANLVISNIDDAYGLKVARQAHQRGMELFILGRNLRAVPADLESVARQAFLVENSPITLMFKQFSRYFCSVESRVKLRAEDTTLILFNHLLNKENPVFLTYDAHTVCHHVSNGMCIADSQETLTYVQKAIAGKAPVAFSETPPDGFNPKASVSAEEFFFHAFQEVDDLPALPGNLVRLDCWPNIKSNAHGHQVVGLSSQITQQFLPINQLLEQHADIAKAFLLATALARLLSYREKTPLDAQQDQPVIAAEKPGIIKKLSRWLGLTTKEKES